jgi:hypothetical protein
MLKPAVSKAIEELKAQFDGRVKVTETGDGGAYVVVDDVELGAPYEQDKTWFGFTLTAVYPYADIYPHFARPDLSRKDGVPLAVPIHIDQNFYGTSAVMISRRTRLTGVDNPNDAALKLLKVHSWLLSQ